MIRSFRSKALSRCWTKDDEQGLRPDWRNKVRIVLSRLEAARMPSEMNLPGLRFHALTGNLKGRFAVSISPNWRITFAWNGDDAIDVDLEDYHGK
jgi:proteic killer suppression protein